MSTLQETLAATPEQPTWSDQDIYNFVHFIKARRKDIKFYSVTDAATKETFVILKWPHQVPGLTILP